MQQKRRIRYIMSFILLTAGVILFVILNICIGTVEISLSDIFASLQGKTVKNARILWDIRMPRTLAAMILGGGLALAGYLLQTFFHNPIAGPFVLGISSGAKMTVAVVMVFLTGKMIRISSGMLIFAAFLGAMISMGFVLLMSTKVHNMSMLVVSGVMIGYICSAITELIITFASDAYQTGEAYAKNMGVKIRLLRALLVILSSILSGCIVAFAGPVSFVGIAVPHLTKNLLGSSKPILMIPACFLGGSVFCLLCDLLARTMFAPTELSISTVTAIFGAPVVLWVMIRRNKEKMTG